MVVVMSWLWLEYAMSLQFIAVLFNVFVHTVMYLYFALAARGIRPWWKRHVTTLQIIQFVTSFLCLFPTLYFRLQGEQCQGFIPLCFSGAFNLSLLIMFMGVKRTQKKRA